MARERLVAILAEDRGARLTLLAAPAGSGKTTLLSAWRESPDEHRPFAWVALDEDDSDPARFWSCVLEALEGVSPGVSRSAAAALHSPGLGIVDGVVPALLNDLAGLDDPLVLVLDDYHLAEHSDVHEGMRELLEHAPPALHVAVATRADPPLPLARWRARGQLVEVRAAQLRFTAEEAGVMLNGALGLGLADEQIVRLQERTEGWAAGLQLAGVSLRGHEDRAGFIASFAGDDRQIVDYLAFEVLDGLPAERRDFLLRTSVLERLSGPLCDAVLETAGSEDELAALERDNLFVVALDGNRRWYRYHHLFRDLLRRELERALPGAARELHRRAAEWLREHDSISDAVVQYTRAGDLAGARDLIARNWYDLLQHGRLATVEAWLDGLGYEAVIADPDLCLIKAWIAINSGRLDELDRWIAAGVRAADDAAADSEGPPIEAGTASLRAIHRYMEGDVGRAVRAGRHALDIEQGGEPSPWRPVGCPVLGLALFWRGDTGQARETLEGAVEEARQGGNYLAEMHAAGGLATIALADGSTPTSERWAELALRLARERGLSEHWAGALAHAAHGEALSRRGELDAATAELERSVDLAGRGVASVETGYVLARLAELQRARGEAEAARELSERARDVVERCADPGRVSEVVAPVRPARRESAFDDLSERELAVLRLLPTPLSQREIGAELFVSLNTVKSHTRSIYRKLDAANRDEAVARARERQLIR